jgi:hypothetical protein
VQQLARTFFCGLRLDAEKRVNRGRETTRMLKKQSVHRLETA